MKMIETFRHDALFVASLFFYAIILLTRRSFSEPVENVYQSLRLEYGGVLKQEWKYGDRDEIDPHLSTVIKTYQTLNALVEDMMTYGMEIQNESGECVLISLTLPWRICMEKKTDK